MSYADLSMTKRFGDRRKKRFGGRRKKGEAVIDSGRKVATVGSREEIPPSEVRVVLDQLVLGIREVERVKVNEAYPRKRAV